MPDKKVSPSFAEWERRQATGPSFSEWERRQATPETTDERAGGVASNPLQMLFDVYNTPQRQMFGAMIGKKDPESATGIGDATGDDLLEAAGMPQGIQRAALGLGLDVVADPMNLIPLTWPMKAVSGLRKAGQTVSKLVDKSSSLSRAADAMIPFRGLDEFIDPSTGLSYRDARRLQDSVVRHKTEEGVQIADDLFSRPGTIREKIPIKEADRVRIAHAIDKGERLGDAHLDKVADEMRATLKKQFDKELPWGVQKNEKYLDNYIPYITAAEESNRPIVADILRGTTRFAKDRKHTSLAAAKAAYPNTPVDAREILAKRLAAGNQAVANTQFFQVVVPKYGVQVGKKTATPAGHRKLNLDNLTLPEHVLEGLKDRAFPIKIADDLEKAVAFYKAENAENLFKTGTKLAKSHMTSMNPFYHPVNFLGNIQNMWVGGMSWKEIANGLKFMNHKIGQWPPPASKIGQMGRYSGDEVLNFAKEYNIIGTSGLLSEIAPVAGRARIAKGEFNPLNPNNMFTESFRQAGMDYIEEPARLAYFANRLKKGDTAEEAALKTKKYLFDYGEVTDFEGKIRDYVFPFYTWSRKNIPLQLEMLLTDPRRAHKLGDVVNFFYEASPETAEMFLNKDLTDEGYVPSLFATGVLQRFPLPVFDANKAMQPGGVPKEAYQMAHPLIKTVIDLAGDGYPVSTSRGYQKPGAAAKVIDALAQLVGAQGVSDALGMEETNEGRRQLDTVEIMGQQIPLAYLMRTLFPVGSFYGRAVPQEEHELFMNPEDAFLASAMGMSPVEVSARSQRFEAQRRAEAERKKVQQAILRGQ